MSNFTETRWCFHILSRTQISIKEGGKRVSHSILCSVPWEEFLKSISLIFGILSSPHLTPLSWWIYELLIVVSFECLTCFCFILFTANVLVSLETANSITSRKWMPYLPFLIYLLSVVILFQTNIVPLYIVWQTLEVILMPVQERKGIELNLLLKRFCFNWVATELILALDP